MQPAESSVERIGEFLVKIGAITASQQAEIAAYQKDHPDQLFGQIAIERGFINDDAIDRFLSSR